MWCLETCCNLSSKCFTLLSRRLLTLLLASQKLLLALRDVFMTVPIGRSFREGHNLLYNTNNTNIYIIPIFRRNFHLQGKNITNYVAPLLQRL
jgi:hypothetical protein